MIPARRGDGKRPEGRRIGAARRERPVRLASQSPASLIAFGTWGWCRAAGAEPLSEPEGRVSADTSEKRRTT